MPQAGPEQDALGSPGQGWGRPSQQRASRLGSPDPTCPARSAAPFQGSVGRGVGCGEARQAGGNLGLRCVGGGRGLGSVSASEGAHGTRAHSPATRLCVDSVQGPASHTHRRLPCGLPGGRAGLGGRAALTASPR